MVEWKPAETLLFWILVIASCLLASLAPAPSAPRFQPMEAARVPAAGAVGPLFETRFIPQPSHLEESYSPALARLASGDLICFFYAGSSEGAPDVSIYRSVFHGSSWSEPRVAVTPRMLGDRTGRFVRKIGNPAVFAAQCGQLHLFVTCVTLGGWSGARIDHLVSSDEGNSWDSCETLKLSPFLNMSYSCRAGPVGLADGGFYLPTYHEMIRCYPEVVRFDREGRFLGKSRLNDRDDLLQPTLMPVSAEEAFVHFRNKGTRDQVTYYQSTRDGGASWSEVRASNFTAPNSSLVTARLDADLYVLVCNLEDRSRIVLKCSRDGVIWETAKLLDGSGHLTFAYPAICVSGGTADLIYAWNDRAALKHVRFNREWLTAQSKG